MVALGKEIQLSKHYFVRLPLLHALDGVSFPLKQQNSTTLSTGFRAVLSLTHFSHAFGIMRGRTACQTVTCMKENSMFRGGTAQTHCGQCLEQAKLLLGVTWSKINFYLEQIKFHFAAV